MQSQLSKTFKGWLGEKQIAWLLNKLPSDKYKVINCILLRNRYSKCSITNIDSIIISEYGIFVIEIKNWHGTLFGDCFDEMWTLNNLELYNPLRQNYCHSQLIKQLFNLNNEVIPIIVFVNKIKLNLSIKDTDIVVTSDKLLDTITSFKTRLIDSEDLTKIVETIEESNINSFVSRIKHIIVVKKHIKQKQMINKY
ncbi:nuclease-related domain-containing protein [Aminipila sp.]|uniref:nuclease-related domain-containing protein n=1 Tax=Aminipila sp. TaxID=2060095 RepID=UPI00289F7310|nr:nuclease-related domain-containing protein [Aminipila sp.]